MKPAAPSPLGIKQPLLHGLRGLAALLIFASHSDDIAVTGFLFHPTTATARPLWLHIMVGSFGAGVELFFMLSGYLIAQSLAKKPSLPSFLWRRILRIYPAFLLTLIITFSVPYQLGYQWLHYGYDLGWARWVSIFISNLLLLPGLLSLPLMQLNAWSLSYEMAFYLVSSVIILKNWWRNIVGKCAALLLIALLLFCYPSMIFFAVGVAVFYAQHYWRRSYKTPLWLSAIALALFLIGHGVVFYLDRLTMGPVTSLSWAHLAWLNAIPASVYFYSLLQGRAGAALSGLLGSAPLQYIGTISYSFYLLHFPIMLWLRHSGLLIIKTEPPELRIVIFIICASIITFLLASMSYQFIEKRVAEWEKARRKI